MFSFLLRKLTAKALQPVIWVFFFLSILFCLDFFHAVDFREKDAIDFRFHLRGPQVPHRDILLVEIDDGSLKALGQWPWPRGTYARLLKILKDYEPAAVFFDILFTEPGAEAAQDEALAVAIQELGNVLLPFYYTSIHPFDAYFPIPLFMKSAKEVGFVNVMPDSDGVTRSLRVAVDADGRRYYNPAVLALKMRNRAATAEEILAELPADQRETLKINYPGSVGVYRRLAFQTVLELEKTGHQAELEEFFYNRIVIIGHTATGTTDLRPTPFSNADVGLSVQAASVHTLLSGDFLRSIPAWAGFVFLHWLCLPLAWVIIHFSLRVGLASFSFVTIGYLLLNFISFTRLGWILPVGVPVAGLGGAAFLALLFKFLNIRMQGEMISRELEMASKIQETFLPSRVADEECFEIAWDYRFLKSVGGDLFDWVRLEGSERGIVIGDVSGKGMPAALYMAKAMSEFRRENKLGRSPAEVCRALNRNCLTGGGTGLFLTLFYGVLDPENHKISFAVAGHEAMIYYQESSQTTCLRATEGGPPLGIFEEADYQSQEMIFEPGDFFLLITDGLRELRNPKGEELGMERLRRVVEVCGRGALNAEETLKKLKVEWTSFQNGAHAHDDYTVMCVRYPKKDGA